ncbi:MAG TPA: ABC transporter permease [Chitinophagaceae bacterium]|nr:ABC transporter permease [Chitinophagaceae bacterium]
MIKNYLKTALRNLLRYKGFSLINILGLSIAITGCLVIGLFVSDEKQFDRFIKDSGNIYRFYTRKTKEAPITSTANVPPMFATHIQQFPEVEYTARILMSPGRRLIEAHKVKAYEDKGFVVDSTFFNVFPLTFLKGDPSTALEDPTSVVLTERTAKKYFGTIEPLGQTIKINNTDFIVKGILADISAHFHLDINYLLPMSAARINPDRMKRWTWQQFFTYIKVKPATDIRSLERKFQESAEREAELADREDRLSFTPYFQPLTDIHLHSSEFVYDNAKRGNATYVKGLAIIAIFVLFIACFNFINLATARSMRRAKEIGIRKVAGAARKQLILQFTGETVLLSILSVIIAAVAAMIILPALNNFTGKSISFNPFTSLALASFLLGSAVMIGILAGFYPALVMSGFQPIKVLKGLKLTGSHKGSPVSLRHGLIVVQFALSALLIISTLVVYKQMNFLNQKDLGFNKDQIIYFNALGTIRNNAGAFKTELLRSPGVISATAGYGLPGDQLAGDGVKIPGKFNDKQQGATLFVADYDYIKTMGLQVIAGRDFSKDHTTDAEQAFIINETGVKEFGFGTPEKALGQKMAWDKWAPDSLNPIKKGEVIGVVKDFHFKSFHEKVDKAILILFPPVVIKVAAKIKTTDIAKTIDHIRTTWNKFSPDFPLDYNFLDENFENMYKSEKKLSGLLWIFTALAIFVGCMGLFGLAAFTAEQRVKEIGIRKILGAGTTHIVGLLSGNFIKLIILALLIASPIAWWVMNKWLQDFVYRVNISWWVFAVAAIAALVIAMLTVSFQAIKVAIANPVKSLRTE